jgi:hypothetical protein
VKKPTLIEKFLKYSFQRKVQTIQDTLKAILPKIATFPRELLLFWSAGSERISVTPRGAIIIDWERIN